MPKRTLLVSTSAERRLLAAGRWLAETAGDEVLVVAPTRGAADDLLRRFQPSRFGVHRTTPHRLAAELATRFMALSGRSQVTGLGVEALAARAIALSAERLTYFRPVLEAPGFARALGRTLSELRGHEVDAEALGATGEPGRDLRHLLTAYEDEADRAGLVDDALLFRLATDEVARGEHRLLGLPLLLLDLSPQTPVEQRFLARLAGRSPAVLATLVRGDEDAAVVLQEALGRPATDLDASVDGASRLERLREHIFVASPARADGAPKDESVVFLAAAGESRESVEIARRIRRLAAEGVPFDRVAVLLRNPDGHLPLVEEALRRAEIPAYFTRGTTRPDPAGRAFLALLACKAERYSASRFAEYLSLGQVPPLDDAGAPPPVEVPWVEPEGDQLVFKSLLSPMDPDGRGPHPPGPPLPKGEGGGRTPSGEGDDVPELEGTLRTPRRWEELLVDAAVVGGRERWKRRLDGLAAELGKRLQSLDDDEATERERLERQRAQLLHLERFALPVIDALAELPDAASWAEWLDGLRRLAAQVLRRPDRVLGLLGELAPMDQAGDVGLDEVRRVLEERLTFLRGEPPDRRYGRVLVATIPEARGRSFDTVFVPGLAEGLFPRRAIEDPLLLDVYRERLGAGLATQDRRVARERLLLRIAAGAARRQLVVSYPNLDALQGRSRVPSFYALDVLRAAEGRLPDLRRLEARAAKESAAILGWPAPRDPEVAIDDAEYDLSTLEPLLRLPPAEATGRGRFLLEHNDALGRSLRTRYLRWRPAFTWADGVVHPDAATREALAGERLRRRSYSPTALQAYATCPYKFLLYAVHRLRPRDVLAPLEQLDPLTRGSLFHEVQFELLGTLREKQLLPMREADEAVLFELADATLDRLAKEYEDELAPAIPRVWESEIEGLRTDLRGWIRAVTGAAEPWRPAYFELSFGLPLEEGHDPASRREEVEVLDGFRLRGSIDVVEVDDERATLRVTDHKTGKPIRDRGLQVGGGETLQPLLYALVAEQLLARPVEAGRLFYCTRRGEYLDVVVPLDEDTRGRIRQVLELVDRAVDDGFLPAAPREKACRWCDYRAVCGPLEELRLDRKRKEDLVVLSELRRMR